MFPSFDNKRKEPDRKQQKLFSFHTCVTM